MSLDNIMTAVGRLLVEAVCHSESERKRKLSEQTSSLRVSDAAATSPYAPTKCGVNL